MKHEKKIMDKFSDQAAEIDPKFRASLKTSLLKQTRSARRKNQKASFRKWFVAIPATVAAALLLGLFVWGGPNSPLSTDKVSAAEVIQNALAQAVNPFDAGQFTLRQATITGRAGPADYCWMEPPRPNSYSFTTEEYSYVGKDGERAYLSTSLNNLNHEKEISMHYDATSPAYDNRLRNQNPGMDILKEADLQAMVGKNNQPLDPETPLAPTTFRNRQAYELRFVEDIEPGRGCDEDDKLRQEIVIDAQTYEILARNEYTNDFSAESLVTEHIELPVYRNVTFDEILPELEAKGFDLEEAKNYGKD